VRRADTGGAVAPRARNREKPLGPRPNYGQRMDSGQNRSGLTTGEVQARAERALRLRRRRSHTALQCLGEKCVSE
jgi:hypothetical protein